MYREIKPCTNVSAIERDHWLPSDSMVLLGSNLHALLGASDVSSSGSTLNSIWRKRSAGRMPKLIAAPVPEIGRIAITPAIWASERCASALLKHRMHRCTIGTYRTVCWGLPVPIHAG